MRNPESDAVSGLVQAVRAFDEGLAQHLISTAELAERVATVIGLDAESIERCRIGGLLHDIGQLGMDRAILRCPHMIADAEWELMMQHPVAGARLLAGVSSLAHLAPIVRAHHERVDGSGYPDALYGYEIPIEARIIAVADAFDAMMTPHEYRESVAATGAMNELIGNAGSQFDIEVVDALGDTIGYRFGRARKA